MKLSDYLTLRAELEGMPKTKALQALSAIACASEPSVWRWHRAEQAPAYAERLMQVWAEATPEQRARWFK